MRPNPFMVSEAEPRRGKPAPQAQLHPLTSAKAGGLAVWGRA